MNQRVQATAREGVAVRFKLPVFVATCTAKDEKSQRFSFSKSRVLFEMWVRVVDRDRKETHDERRNIAYK